MLRKIQREHDDRAFQQKNDLDDDEEYVMLKKTHIQNLLQERDDLVNEVQKGYENITTLALQLKNEEKYRAECQEEITGLKKELALIKAERFNEVHKGYENITTLALQLKNEEKYRAERQEEITGLKKELALIKDERDALLLRNMSPVSCTGPTAEQEEQVPMREERNFTEQNKVPTISPLAARALFCENDSIERQDKMRRTAALLSSDDSSCNIDGFDLSSEESQNADFSPFSSGSSTRSKVSFTTVETPVNESTNGTKKCIDDTTKPLTPTSTTTNPQQDYNKTKEDICIVGGRRDACNALFDMDEINNPLFHGNEELVEFFLPNLEMKCSCNKKNKLNTFSEKMYCDFCQQSSSSNNADKTSLKNILRSWQVEFLASLEITTADCLLLAYEQDADEIVKSMKEWRVKVLRDTGVRTQSCSLALHIWYRTAKSIIQSIEKQGGGEGLQQIQQQWPPNIALLHEKKSPMMNHQPLFEISFPENHLDSVSSLGSYGASISHVEEAWLGGVRSS